MLVLFVIIVVLVFVFSLYGTYREMALEREERGKDSVWLILAGLFLVMCSSTALFFMILALKQIQ